MQTVYGPPQGGAGSRVLLNDQSVPLVLGAYGTSLFVAPYPKGPVGKCVIHSGKDHFARVRTADLLVEDQGPLAGRHFFEKSRGRGTLITFRVADGNQRAADLPIYDRVVDTTVRGQGPDTKYNTKVGTLMAASEGCWGGADIWFGDQVADGAAAASGSEWTTGYTGWVKNELKGGYLFIGTDTRPRLILSNTAAGGITVSGDFSDLTLAAAPTDYHVVKESVDFQGLRKELAVKIKDGMQNANGCFGFQVYQDGSLFENPWNDLNLDTDDSYHWEKIVQESLKRLNQYELDVDNDFTGDPSLEWLKPANFAEIAVPSGVGTNTLEFEVFRYLRSGTGNGYIARNSWTAGASILPHVLTLTVLSGALTYSVVARDFSGRLIADSLPNGTIGVAYGAPHAHLSGHTLSQGSTPFVAGDVVTVYCRCLPLDLAARGAYFYPYAFAATGTGSKDVTTAYRVTANTYKAITLAPTVDLTGVAVEPGKPLALGTTAGPYNTSGGGKTIKGSFKLDGAAVGIAFNVTVIGGATDDATALVGHINTALGVALETRVEAYVGTDDAGIEYVGFRATATWCGGVGGYGPLAVLRITDGTINATIGLTDNTDHAGVTPTTGRLEWNQCFNGGRDGHHDLANEDYTTTAFDTEESPILDLIPENLGLVNLFTPGEDGAIIQQAAVDFVKTAGCFYWGNIPADTASENAAKKWLRDNITPNRHAAWIFPSYGDLAENPFGGMTAYQCTILGAVAGLLADKANEYGGYHKAPAGPSFRIDPLFRRLATDASDEPSPVKDWLLNPAGIQQAVHQGGAITLMGDETADYNHQGTVWIHKVRGLLHLVTEIRANLLQYQYDVADQGLRNKIVSSLRELLRVHYEQGWFRGSSLNQAVQVSSNDANNPPEVQALGKVVAAVYLEIVETNKNTDIYLGTKGVSVGV